MYKKFTRIKRITLVIKGKLVPLKLNGTRVFNSVNLILDKSHKAFEKTDYFEKPKPSLHRLSANLCLLGGAKAIKTIQ